MKRFILTPQFFGSLLFDRKSCRYFPFDDEATGFLNELAGNAGPSIFGPSTGRRDLVESLYDAGFLDLNGRFPCKIQSTDPVPGLLTGPLAVHLEVSRTCNLSCQHCFADLHPRKEEGLSLFELNDLFAELAHLGSFRLGLTGGEPFLRPDLLKIVDSALAHGLHPCITTNGTVLTREYARELGRRKPLWLNVSLEGPTRQENDAIRGAGAFEKVMAQLDGLGSLCDFALCFTVTSRNHDRVEECVRLAEKVGAITAVFRPLYPVGSALNNLELMPTFEMYRNALQTLAELEGYQCHNAESFGPESPSEHPFGLAELEGCGAGKSVCSISYSGEVSPCSFLGESQVVGNVRGRSFGEIWRSETCFRPFRNVQPEPFVGGCRLRALRLNGSIHEVDPWHALGQEVGGAKHG